MRIEVSVSVQVEDDVWLPEGSRLLVELTASKGETILAKGRKGEEPKILTREIKFFNYLLDSTDLLTVSDFCLIVYNGTDPVEVKIEFEALTPRFRGAVVHFQRKFVIKWEAEEAARQALDALRAFKEESERELESLREQIKKLTIAKAET